MAQLKKHLLLSALTLVSATAFAFEPPAELRAKFEKIGNVKEVQETSVKNMYAWLLEKNGKVLVLYNTPDNKSFIKGTVYDLDTKQILSDRHASDALKYASPDFRQRVLGGPMPGATQANSVSDEALNVGYMNLKWKGGQIPDALKFIDNLAGVKEGKGQPQDTLYILYDPRCVWCHKTYDGLREYAAKGYTIKWLPTVALGRSEQALALASAPLQDRKMLDESFKKSAKAKKTVPNQKNIKDIDTNLQFLFAYFNKVIPDQKPSVPLALFLNKTDGKVTHIQGLPDQVVVDVLFGEGK